MTRVGLRYSWRRNRPRRSERISFVVVRRVAPAERHWLRLLAAGQRFGRGVEGVGDGVAAVDVGDVLDLGGEVADLPRRQFFAGHHARTEAADVVDDVFLAV